MKIPNLTPFKNVNTILDFYVNNAHDIFKNDLIGIYLWGSLSYDAFTIKKSDIDLVVILKKFQAINKYDIVNEYHGRISKIYEKWSTRLECLYTSADVLDISSIPKDKMLWYYGRMGMLFSDNFGENGWIIVKYLLYNHAIALFGPEYKDIASSIPFEDVEKGCIKGFQELYEGKKADKGFFENSFYVSYFVLTICRSLYTIFCHEMASKQDSAKWAINIYGEPWSDIIKQAEQWEDGIELNITVKALEFMDFAMEEIRRTTAYNQVINKAN